MIFAANNIKGGKNIIKYLLMATPNKLGEIAMKEEINTIHSSVLIINLIFNNIPKKLNKFIGKRKNIPVEVLNINGKRLFMFCAS